MNNTSTSLSEYEAIAHTVKQYVNGGRSGKSEDMKPAFHADATIFGYIGPDLFAGPIQGLFDWNDQNGPATGLQARIASIDIIGTIATARITCGISTAKYSVRIQPAFWNGTEPTFRW